MNSFGRYALMLAGLVLVVALAVYAQEEPATPPPADQPKEEAPKEEAPKEAAPKEKPAPELGPAPKSPGGSIVLPRKALLKENTRLIDVEGLVLDLKVDLNASPVSRAIFQPRDGSGYFILLENALLEKTLAETAHGERPVKVRGTVSIFRGKNYLMLDYAAVKQE